MLSVLLGREIVAEAEREDFYYWFISLSQTPLSESELETLLVLADAIELAKNNEDFCKYPVTELFEELCNSLMCRLLPFAIVSVRADDDGVWFIGKAHQESHHKLNPLTTEQLMEHKRLERPIYHYVPGDSSGSGWITLSNDNPDDWGYGSDADYGTAYVAYDREPDTMWPKA